MSRDTTTKFVPNQRRDHFNFHLTKLFSIDRMDKAILMRMLMKRGVTIAEIVAELSKNAPITRQSLQKTMKGVK